MRIRMVRTGEVRTVADSLGARMCEQGKAVCLPAAPGQRGRKGGKSPKKEESHEPG